VKVGEDEEEEEEDEEEEEAPRMQAEVMRGAWGRERASFGSCFATQKASVA
jgi:hypothetical protein